jgi:hypothetical protein
MAIRCPSSRYRKSRKLLKISGLICVLMRLHATVHCFASSGASLGQGRNALIFCKPRRLSLPTRRSAALQCPAADSDLCGSGVCGGGGRAVRDEILRIDVETALGSRNPHPCAKDAQGWGTRSVVGLRVYFLRAGFLGLAFAVLAKTRAKILSTFFSWRGRLKACSICWRGTRLVISLSASTS